MAVKSKKVGTGGPVRVGIPAEDKVLYTVITIILSLWMIVVIYPIIFIVSSSFSSANATAAGRVLLWPVEFSVVGYKIVFAYRQVWIGYANTLLITVGGTVLNLGATILAAYPLARKNLQFRPFYMALYIITMFFSGGLIPVYIQMVNLGMVNNRWSMILPGLIGTHNMIIMRTFFQNSIPGELQEAASIDGCNDIRYLIQVVLPLSKSVMSVLCLYYAVGHWNAYFSAMLYLRDAAKQPLQLILRTILIAATSTDLTGIEGDAAQAAAKAGESMRYALIVVSTVPILLLYPYIQKHFAKGVMIGSLKG